VASPINLGAALPDVNHDVNLFGPGAGLLTVQRTSASNFRIFTISDGRTVSIFGLTLANGNASGGSFPQDAGGAVFNGSGTLTLTDLVISGNNATSSGGGVNNTGGNLT